MSRKIKYYIENNDILKKSINMSYKKKYKLSDIANIINKLSDNNKVEIKIDNILLLFSGLTYYWLVNVLIGIFLI